MTDPIDTAILLIKERGRADAAEARLKRLIEECETAFRYLDGWYFTGGPKTPAGRATVAWGLLRDALREARGPRRWSSALA